MSTEENNKSVKMRFFRFLLPAFPLYAPLVPLVLIWAPQIALLIWIALLYLLYPYAFAWDQKILASRELRALAHGELFTILHWVVTYCIYLIITKKFTDKKATLIGIAMIPLSAGLAHVILQALGYKVKIHIDF